MILILSSVGLSQCVAKVKIYTADEDMEKGAASEVKIPEDERKYYLPNWLPLTTGVITAHLRKAGFRVRHCDLFHKVSYSSTSRLAEDDFAAWLIHDKKTPLMEEYLHQSFIHLPPGMEEIKLIGISVKSFIQYPYALSLAKEINIRFPHIPICMGGCYVTLSHHNYPPYISYIVKGNGGRPICHLAGHIINGSPYNPNFPGLYKISPSRPPRDKKNNDPIDSEEFPDFSDLNLADYLTYQLNFLLPDDTPHRPYLVFEYRTSMGCSNKCTFCSARKVDRLEFKGVGKVIAELKQFESLARDYSDKLFLTFVDMSLNNHPAYINEIMDGIIENHIDIRWYSFAKVHHMSPELLEKFYRAGCRALFWGIEAATPRMLKIFNKRSTPEEAEKCILKAVELKIVSMLSMIYNAPGETDQDFEELLNFTERMSRYKPYAAVRLAEFRILENSEFWNHPAKFNIEVVKRNQYPDSIIPPTYEWREAGVDWDEMRERHRIRRERVEALFKTL